MGKIMSLELFKDLPRGEELDFAEVGFSSEDEMVEFLDRLASESGASAQVDAKYAHLCGEDGPADAVVFNHPELGKVQYNSGYYPAYCILA